MDRGDGSVTKITCCSCRGSECSGCQHHHVSAPSPGYLMSFICFYGQAHAYECICPHRISLHLRTEMWSPEAVPSGVIILGGTMLMAPERTVVKEDRTSSSRSFWLPSPTLLQRSLHPILEVIHHWCVCVCIWVSLWRPGWPQRYPIAPASQCSSPHHQPCTFHFVMQAGDFPELVLC